MHFASVIFELCSVSQIGSLTSLFPIAYGFSKFVSGVLGARTSPRVMLAGGLMATAAVNLAFGAGNSLPWFLTFWAINGILQVHLWNQKPCGSIRIIHAAPAAVSHDHLPYRLCWGREDKPWHPSIPCGVAAKDAPICYGREVRQHMQPAIKQGPRLHLA